MDRESSKTIKELKAANELKTKWLSLIAHDFKGLFSNIQLLLTMLQEENISQEVFLSMLPELKEISDKNSKIVDSTFAWIKSQADGFNLQIENIVIYNLYQEIIHDLNEAVISKGVTVNYVGSERLSLETDKFLFRFILKQLLDNAVKYSHPKSKVDVRVYNSDNTIEITISDTGIGMDKKVVQNIATLDVSPCTGTINEKGAGLSLVVVKDFVEMLGGQIAVKSFPGKGTDVSITFYNK